MPLYPCVAILLGLIIESCVFLGAAEWERRSWIRFVVGCAITFLVAGLMICGLATIVQLDDNPLKALTPEFSIIFSMMLIASSAILIWSVRRRENLRVLVSLLTVCVVVGFSYAGTFLSIEASRLNDLTPSIAQIRQQLPDPEKLISFGPVDHRFCYYFEDQIKELPWPETMQDVPCGRVYFCFDRHPFDPPTVRLTGRGRTWSGGTFQLPFQWEEVAKVCVERRLRHSPQSVVVIAKIIDPVTTVALQQSADQSRRH